MKTKRIARMLACLLLLVVMGGEFLFSAFFITASAQTFQHSTALNDLGRDPSFDPADYPSVPGDNSIKVIQIGEGTNGELYVYTYQPGNIERSDKATHINMSLQPRSDQNPGYNLYPLTWINTDGVFGKYIVNNFTVSHDLYRYYNIASVYRAFDSRIDEPAAEADDNRSFVAFPVGYCFCAYYYNDALIYENEQVEVVDIEILAVGSVRYTNGFKLYVDKCDAHFVAFSVENYDVDRIYDATIVYTTEEKRWNYTPGVGESTEYSNRQTVTKDITDMETGSNDGDGLFGVKYSWNRILTKNEFQEQLEDFTNEEVEFSKGGLGKAQFVFQFLETDYSFTATQYSSYEYSTVVSDVGILRLHFLSEGRRYNLGVVSDLLSDDGVPDFEVTIMDNFENQEWWQKIMTLLGIILLVVLFSFFSGPLTLVLKILWQGLMFILRVLLWLLLLPFKLLIRLFKH